MALRGGARNLKKEKLPVPLNGFPVREKIFFLRGRFKKEKKGREKRPMESKGRHRKSRVCGRTGGCSI